MRTLLKSIEAEYGRYKTLAEGAIQQLADEDLGRTLGQGSGNCVATIVGHVAGNLESRFTDFLTSDGEKPWRNREGEFELHGESRAGIMLRWDRGWARLLDTLASLSDSDLTRGVTIRGVPLAVHEALHRSLSHTSYHVGQIVFIARGLRGSDWRFLSIPPGATAEYHRTQDLEKAPRPLT